MLLLVLCLSAAPALGETPAVPVESGAPPAAVKLSTKAAEETQPGLLDFDPQSGIWVLAIFLVLVYILYKSAWKNVLTGLKRREERIRNDITQAEEARLKAEETLKGYNIQLAKAEDRARDIIAKATVDAQTVADRIKADADKDAKDRVERAARDIEEARKQAIRDIYAEAATLSTSIAEKILRRNLNPDDQRDLVAQSLEQASSVNRG